MLCAEGGSLGKGVTKRKDAPSTRPPKRSLRTFTLERPDSDADTGFSEENPTDGDFVGARVGRLRNLLDVFFGLAERGSGFLIALDGRAFFILARAQLYLLCVSVGFLDQLQALEVRVAIPVGHRRVIAMNHGAGIFLAVFQFRLPGFHDAAFFWSFRAGVGPRVLLTSFSASSKLLLVASEISRVSCSYVY